MADVVVKDPERDARLCKLVQSGRAAMTELLEVHKHMVFRIVADMALPPQVDRDDLVQHGLLAVVRAAEKWVEGQSQFNTYAWTCVLNAVRRQAGVETTKTTSLNKRPLDDSGAALLDLIPAPERPEPPPGVRERIPYLPPLYRRVLVLFYGLDSEPMQVGEIARQTGLTCPQVKRAISAALKQM